MTRPHNFFLVMLLACISFPVLSAGACTYSEAIMALEQGNTVRGLALMRMAQRDGDQRATVFLAERDYPMTDRTISSVQMDDSVINLSQNSSK